jgi:hypothetical protein
MKRTPFHPLIFAAFPILSLFIQNMGKGYLREALFITAGAVFLCLVLWLLVRLLVGDRERSALIVSAFFFLLLSFGHALSAAEHVLQRTGLIDQWWVLVWGSAADLAWVVIWVLLFAAVAFYVARRLKNIRLATDLLNVVAFALLLILGINFLTAGGFQTYVKPYVDDLLQNARAAVSKSRTETGQDLAHRISLPLVRHDPEAQTKVPTFGHAWLEASPVQISAPGAFPDIYYIVLDMYARSDVLHERFKYDNSEFLSFLEDRGFYVAHESTANYPYTTHSLASSLNYMYVNEVAEQVGSIQKHSLSASMIANNRLFRHLENQGYETVAFATGYWFTEFKDSDAYLEPTRSWWFPSEFQAGLIELTPLSRVPGIRGTEDDVARERVLYPLDHLADVAEMDSPALVFAHINAPHDPFVFGADGRPVASKLGYTYEEFTEAYREQAAFVTRKAQQTIEEILRRSPEPPIIILQSDHGVCYGPYEEHLTERMSILNAYHFPNQDYEDLYETITPVNTFRVVLNQYFGTDYVLLDDRNYFSDNETPYSFVDVTDEVSGDD